MKTGYVGHRHISKPDGSTKDSWAQFICGHCGISVSAAVVAKYCYKLMSGSMRETIIQ